MYPDLSQENAKILNFAQLREWSRFFSQRSPFLWRKASGR